MKQVLSVADFATILDLVNNEIANMKFRAVQEYGKECDKKALFTALSENPYYCSLQHLKNSLESLNIEVKCPDVEIKEEKQNE